MMMDIERIRIQNCGVRLEVAMMEDSSCAIGCCS